MSQLTTTNGNHTNDLDVPSFDDVDGLRNWLSSHKTPLSMVETRPGRGGETFYYVRHQYITRILNEICGHDWDFEVKRERLDEDRVTVLGRLTLRVGPHTIVKEQFGGHDVERYNSGNKSGQPLSMGDAFKSAASDALKKCASLIGLGVDLSLPIQESTRRKLHAVGTQMKGDNWDESRRKAVRMLTKGKKTSSNNLLDVEARILIGMMQGEKAEIINEARKRMS